MPPSSAMPSLFDWAPAPVRHDLTTAGTEAASLLDLMYDGFYLLFLLKGKHAPVDADTFRDRIKQFLTAFERGATRLQADAEDVYACKYAFCATVDEAVMMSSFKVRDAWQRLPLQLQFFGEQLAGEQFFERLEALRREGARRVQALEVFHMCLLLGFQGKYLLEGTEKLNYLTARLGDEIARMKGHGAAFAPHWAAPDKVQNQLKNEVPLWVVGSVFGVMALAGFLGLRWQLTQQTRALLGEHHHIVQLAPQVANVTITLP